MGKTYSPTQLRDNSSTMHYQNIIKSGDSWGKKKKKIINLGYDKLKRKKKSQAELLLIVRQQKGEESLYIISQNSISNLM